MQCADIAWGLQNDRKNLPTLQEAALLYSWDRPATRSPVKKRRKEDLKIGNAVFVFTALPDGWEELDAWMGGTVKGRRPTARELGDSFLRHGSQATMYRISDACN